MNNMTWKEKLLDLKCVNGAMYLGAVETPCSGRETGECCQNEQTFEEAKKELEDFIEKQIEEAVEEERFNNLVERDIYGD